MNLALVALGGALGALSRYLVSALATRWLGGGFAWGTAIVNIAGCFAIGVAAGFLERSVLPRGLWLLLVTGFLGGFTTFSTFSLETLQALQGGFTLKALVSIAANTAGGLAACAGGLSIALRLPERLV